MIRYLLGDLTTAEQELIESDYFTDPERFEQLQAVEHDLIEGYLSGKLSATERANFKRHYMASPARRQQVRFFRILNKVMPLGITPPVLPVAAASAVTEQATVPPVVAQTPRTASKPSWWESFMDLFTGQRLMLGAMAAAGLIVVATVAWQILESSRVQRDLAQANADRAAMRERERGLQQQADAQQQQNEQLNQERETIRQKQEPVAAPAPKPASTVASFTWALGGLRDTTGGSQTTRNLRIPSGTDLIQL
ncbi:MAG TPA: hypothetical protein VJ302_04020, partial [Blastocatellia bacterium]|nr:hypothetical protein [Blastocatellia bacterium]